MTEDPKRDRAIDRVRKLLSLSRSQNEHEAATAAAQAARIMAQHGLDADDLEAADDPVGDNRDLHVEIGKSKRPASWKWNLAWHVAEAGHCKPYVLHRKIGEDVVATMIAFIGRRSDAQLCVYLLNYLLRELTRLHGERRPKVGMRLQQYIPGSAPVEVDRAYQKRWSNDFYMGGVVALSTRMRKATDEVMRTADTTALVLLGQRTVEVDETAAELGLSYVKGREFDIRSQQGFASGIAAGRQIDLSTDHPQLGEGQRRLSDGSDDR